MACIHREWRLGLTKWARWQQAYSGIRLRMLGMGRYCKDPNLPARLYLLPVTTISLKSDEEREVTYPLYKPYDTQAQTSAAATIHG